MSTQKTQSPFFSIIIPCLNEEKTIPKLLVDLMRQTYKDFEVIVVDGKSQDKTVKKSEKFGKKLNLKVITSGKRNVSFQRNLGAKSAKADWLIFFDADNRLPIYFLQGIKFWVEMLSPDILSSWIEPDSRNNKDKAVSTITNLYTEVQKNTNKPSVLESFICLKKRPFNKLRGFNENLNWGEGGDLLERALKLKMDFQLVRTPRYTYSFRRLRKQGTLEVFRRFAQLELSRMINKRTSLPKTKILYPMEGGSFYEVDSETASRIEKLARKIFQNSPAKDIIQNSKKHLLSRLKKIIRST